MMVKIGPRITFSFFSLRNFFFFVCYEENNNKTLFTTSTCVLSVVAIVYTIVTLKNKTRSGVRTYLHMNITPHTFTHPVIVTK